jgi:hypothetical protein
MITLLASYNTNFHPDTWRKCISRWGYISDIRRNIDSFHESEDGLGSHECFDSCTHCRVCFDLDCSLLRPNGYNETEREIRSRFRDMERSEKYGCPICSLLTWVVKAAFSADNTGKALKAIERISLDICVRNGRTVFLRFSSDTFELAELEYFTLVGITRREVMQIFANSRLDRSS